MPRKRKTPYEVLDVPPKADKETIKRAYRKKARETHPDKGGDHEKFAQVSNAYRLLCDSQRRERFDQAGDESEPVPLRQQAIAAIGELFSQLVQQIAASPVEIDILRVLRESLREGITATTKQIDATKRGMAKLEKTKGKLVNKNKESGPLEAMLETHIDGHKALIGQLTMKVDVGSEAIEILKAYEYFPEKMHDLFATTTKTSGIRFIFTGTA